MAGCSSPGVTELLVAWSSGDRTAIEPLITAVYAQLKRLARRQLARDREQTLQPTALVHEAYITLIDQRAADWQNRAHFFAIAAQAMRRIILKAGRRRRAAKRGGGVSNLDIDDAAIPAGARAPELIALDEALTKLAEMDPRQSQIVELRYFGGLDVEETAVVVGVSAATIKREWRSAKAWLHKEITRSARE
jgi:RNA polymerase sigma factor (TIGR02999 family)